MSAISPSEQALYDGASQVINTATGMALQSRNIKKQVKAQGKIMAMQAKQQRELSEYQQQQQLEMWKATNYQPQVEELKKAGLSPALIYGMKGGGGVTTGAGLPSAPSGGGIDISMPNIPTYGLQMAQQKAQIELTQAQTENIKANTTKTGGVDTEAVKTGIEQMKQQTNNAKAQEYLTKAQTYAQEFTNLLKDETRTMALEEIKQNLKMITINVKKAEAEEKVLRKSANSQIEIYKQQALEAGWKTILTKSQIRKTNQEIMNLSKDFSNKIQQNMRDWDKMSQTDQEISIKKILAQVEEQKLNINPKDVIQLIHIITDL